MPLRPLGDEKEKIFARRCALIEDTQAFTRALQYLKRARASKKRAGRELTWRDAEAELHGRIATCIEMYERARKAAA